MPLKPSKVLLRSVTKQGIYVFVCMHEKFKWKVFALKVLTIIMPEQTKPINSKIMDTISLLL